MKAVRIMALEIFKLVGSIFVDTDAANKSMAKTDEKASGIGKTLASGIKTAGKWGAAMVGTTAAVVTGIAAFANKTSETTDEIDKMSQRLGLSREAYQELDFALAQSGVDVNSFQTGMKSLLANMDRVTEGNKTSIKNFAALGVSVTDASGKMRDQESVLWDTIQAFQNMEDSAEKSRLAQELFGKQGQEIIPLLNAQAGGIDAMRKQAHDLGLVLGDDLIDTGVQLHDTIDQLKRTGESLFTQVGGEIMPLVQDVAGFIIDAMPQIHSLFEQLSPVIQNLFSNLLPPLLDLGSQIFPLLIDLIVQLLPFVTQITEKVLPIIVDLCGKLLPPLIEIVQKLLPPLLDLLMPILDLLDPILDLLDPILDLVIGILDPLVELINGLLTPLIKVITDLIGFALVPLKSNFENLSGTLTGVFNAAIGLVMNQVEEVKGVFSGLIQFITGVFTGDWESAWEGVQQIFGSVWEGISNGFKIPINFIIEQLNGFIRGINNIQIPDWVPLVGGRGFYIPQIPKLETGAVLEKGQTGFLEGTGAEAVVPLHENRKWIKAVADDMEDSGIGGGATAAILEDIRSLLEEIKNGGVWLDTGALVGGIVKPLDKQLGILAVQKARA